MAAQRDRSHDTSHFEYSSLAQHVIFGAGSLDQLGTFIERFYWQRILLCTSGSLTRSGRVDQIRAALGERLVATYDHVQPHVPDFQVSEISALARQHTIDAVIGLGGGSPIGMAKAVSFGLQQVPVIAIPTTYAGSEMTPVYGVTHHTDGTARKVTVSDPKIAPRFVLYDPRLTFDLSPELTASTGINAFAHCIEAVYSIKQNPLSTAAALEGACRIARALPQCYAKGDDLEARSEMQVGSHLAGVALAHVAMGLHHGLCHVLGGTAGVPHGIANAIILPYAIEYNADVCARELALVARAVGIEHGGRDDLEQARQLAEWVRGLVWQMNLPQRLRDVGVKESDRSLLAQLAAESRTVQNNAKPAALGDIAAILQAAW